MADVFVSYKRENQAKVQDVVRGLRAGGLSVWWDQDIAPDAPWEATIEAELTKAKVVVVAWSLAAVASENVKAEARRARQDGKLVQMFVEACTPPLFFGERQGVDLSRWNGDPNDHRFQAVVKAAQAIRNGRKPPAGVGYAPRKRSGLLPAFGLAVAVLVAALSFNIGGARDSVCAVSSIAALCRTATPVTQAAQTAEPVSEPEQTQPIEGQRLQAGVEYRLEVPFGHAVDFDSGEVSASINARSDFVISEQSYIFLDQTSDPAGTRPDTAGSPTRAMCPTGEYYYRAYLAGPGEYNCFMTRERREGVLIRQADRSGFAGVVITYKFWDD